MGRKFLLLLCLLCFAGCSPEAQLGEKEEKHYVRGQQLLKENKPQEALAAFLKVIEKRRDAADSHLEAGRLYLTVVKDPIQATYHFNRYLELRPESDEAPLVRQLLDTCTKEFIRQLPGKPFANELARADMAEELKRLETENAALKRDLDQARQQLAYLRQTRADSVPVVSAVPIASASRPSTVSNGAATAAAQPQPSPQSFRTYTVQSGDTLSRISSKLYGTPNRWKEIYEANRDRMPSPGTLKLGQQLRIPR